MNDRERRRLLDRLQRPSNSIGGEIPDRLDVQGRTVDLKAFVFECKRLDAVPGDYRDRVDDLTADLRRERLARKQRLEDGDLTVAEGEALVRSIHGIDRALNALESLDEPGIGEDLRQKQLEDARDLLALADVSL